MKGGVEMNTRESRNGVFIIENKYAYKKMKHRVRKPRPFNPNEPWAINVVPIPDDLARFNHNLDKWVEDKQRG